MTLVKLVDYAAPLPVYSMDETSYRVYDIDFYDWVEEVPYEKLEYAISVPPQKVMDMVEWEEVTLYTPWTFMLTTEYGVSDELAFIKLPTGQVLTCDESRVVIYADA